MPEVIEHALPITMAKLKALQVAGAGAEEPTAPSDAGTTDESLDENPPQTQDTQDKA